MKAIIRAISFITILGLLSSSVIAMPVAAASASYTAHSIGAAAPADANPLKGLAPQCSTSGNTFPHSLEMFYIPLKDVQTGMNTFDWVVLEKKLNLIASRGDQAIIRFYLDYPKWQPTGIPQFLLDGGLVTYPYTYYENTSSVIPNYEDPNLRMALRNFIAAFGAKYDNDPRIGFIEAGLLGHWGEWHNGKEPTKMASTTVMNEVLTSYRNAFKETKLLVRVPKDNVDTSGLGFHDDSFCWSTLPVSMSGGGSWYFIQLLLDANPSCYARWQTMPIGGEIRPEIQPTIFDESPWGSSHNNSWADCIATAHPSWLTTTLNYTGTERDNALTASKQLGYDFQLATAYFDNVAAGSNFHLGIDIKNIGIAPFYYKWDFEIGIKQNGQLVRTWDTGWDITAVPADATITKLSYDNANNDLPVGNYTISIKLVNPLPNGKSLRLSNVGQNADGWLDLGIFSVNAATVPVKSLAVSATSKSLTIGETATLTATVAPANATNKSVTWTSDKTSVAKVDSAGKVTAVAAGTATITAKTADGGYTAACTVTVNASTGGGASGSGDSGSATKSTVSTTTDSTGISTTTATITVVAVTDTNGSAIFMPTTALLKDTLNAAVSEAAKHGSGSKAVVKILVDSGIDSSSISTVIPKSALDSIIDSNANGLMIATVVGTVTFDSIGLNSIRSKASDNIKIMIAKSDVSKLSVVAQKAIGGRPVYDFSITSGSETISSFDGTAYVSIPYSLRAGENASKIVIYDISDSGELVLVPNCFYDSSTEMITFKTMSLHKYGMGYNDVCFSDVSGWYEDYVNFLAARGIVSGTGNGMFRPDASITRAQFVTILAKLSGDNLGGYNSSSATDVQTNDWYFAAVQWAYEKGIVTGADGRFNPNATITRQDIAVMVARYAEKVTGYSLPKTAAAITFTDSAEMASYASEAVTTMQRAGIISGGGDGSFAPTSNATRAQAAKIIALFLQATKNNVI